jgi:hypothetical protein
MAHNDDLDKRSDELLHSCIGAKLTDNDHKVAAMHLAKRLLAKLMTLPQEKRRECLMWLLQHMRGPPSAAPLQERMALPTIVDSKHACLMYIKGLVRLSSADEFNRNVTVLLSEVERTRMVERLLAKLMTLPQEKRRKCLMWLLQHMRGAPSAAPLQERMALPTIVDSKHACLMYIEGLVRLSSADEFNRNVTVFLRTLSELERTRMVESERLGKTQREQRRGGNPY